MSLNPVHLLAENPQPCKQTREARVNKKCVRVPPIIHARSFRSGKNCNGEPKQKSKTGKKNYDYPPKTTSDPYLSIKPCRPEKNREG